MNQSISEELKEKFERTDFSGNIGGFVWCIKDSQGEDYEIENLISFIQSKISEEREKQANIADAAIAMSKQGWMDEGAEKVRKELAEKIKSIGSIHVSTIGNYSNEEWVRKSDVSSLLEEK